MMDDWESDFDEVCKKQFGNGDPYWPDLVAALRGFIRAQIAQLQAAINEALSLADFLNQAATQGAGFAEHWGERVMQAVEPLRDVEAFAGRTLEHNRSLLDYNGELIERANKLQAEVARLKKFDVKFAESYENLTPVGPPYDVLEWQAKLQSELGLLKVRHQRLQADYDRERGLRLEVLNALIDLEAWAAYHSAPNTTLLNAALEKARALKIEHGREQAGKD